MGGNFIKKKSKLLSVSLLLVSFFVVVFVPVHGAEAASLSGRILLQVQSHGEAWYVNPSDSKRYYLGRPDDAYSLMRSLGLGATDGDIGSYQISKAPSRLSGRILLQVQDKGQAFYVNPLDLKLYYLGRPADAFSVMRSLGLGISNTDLNRIAIGGLSTPSVVQASPAQTTKRETASTPSGSSFDRMFEFRYKNSDRILGQTLYSGYFDSYSSSPKSYSYNAGSDLSSARNSFYALFLNVKSGDDSIAAIAAQAKATAQAASWSEDETVEFLMSLVQYIPYDTEKVAVGGLNISPYYPYETMYLNRGVCSDKTFFAVLLLRQLGYGAAILDFPDSNHSAAGISCPVEYSIAGSGYCYIETTNYFPLGVVPKGIRSGIATDNGSDFDNVFDISRLGKLEIYQKTTGKTYYRVSQTVSLATEISALDDVIKSQAPEITSLETTLKSKEVEISAMKIEMDKYLAAGYINQYNALVRDYNAKVVDYNAILSTYTEKATSYNSNIARFNKLAKEFYQK